MARTRTRKRTVYRIEIHEITTITPSDPNEKQRIESKIRLQQDTDSIDLPAILKAVNGMA